LASITKGQIEAIRAQAAGSKAGESAYGGVGAPAEAGAGADNAEVLKALEKLERRLDEMNERLGKIEEQVSTTKK
jgi:hypothetical protein